MGWGWKRAKIPPTATSPGFWDHRLLQVGVPLSRNADDGIPQGLFGGWNLASGMEGRGMAGVSTPQEARRPEASAVHSRLH
jgi:hypothetical protein